MEARCAHWSGHLRKCRARVFTDEQLHMITVATGGGGRAHLQVTVKKLGAQLGVSVEDAVLSLICAAAPGPDSLRLLWC